MAETEQKQTEAEVATKKATEEEPAKADVKAEAETENGAKAENGSENGAKAENGSGDKKADDEAKNGAAAAKEAPSEELLAKILEQVEYYFGDFSLPRDKFLLEKIKENEDGWVSMDVMLKFQRLAKLSTDVDVILQALEKSDLMDVEKEGKKIRRTPSQPLPEWTDERKKALMANTVYCKGLNKDKTTLDHLLNFFKQYDMVDNVCMRTYVDRKDPKQERKFKGSIFVTFTDVAAAEKFMALEQVKYVAEGEDGDGAVLERKWQKDYFEVKQKEFDERKKQKLDEKKQLKKSKDALAEKQAEAEAADIPEFPKGAVLELNGLNKESMREDIKDKLIEAYSVDKDDVAFINFQKGDENAKVRFRKEGEAVRVCKLMTEQTDPVQIKEATVTFKVLEGEDEEAFLKKAAEEMKERRNNVHNRRGHKRRGGFGGGGRGGKRGRRN